MTPVWTAWAAVLAPAGAAAVLAVAPGRLAGWVMLGGTLAALALAGLLLPGSVGAAAGLRADALAAGLAVLAAGLAAAEALCLARPALPRLERMLAPAALAGTLLALLAELPGPAWIGLATAAAASLLSGRIVPLPAAAGLGLAGLGTVLLQAPGGRAVGFVLLLAGCGLLATMRAALALPAVALVLRGRGLVEAGFAGPPLLAVGLGLIAAAALAPRTDRAGLTGLAAAGPGLALFAFGLGSPAAAAAGLLGLAASCLAQGAAAARPQPRWLRAAGLAALAGLPPFGVFAGWVMVLAETARRLPLLCLPLGAGLAACAWTVLRQPLPPAGLPDPLRSAAAGLQLAALAALGLGLLPGAQAWLAAAP